MIDRPSHGRSCRSPLQYDSKCSSEIGFFVGARHASHTLRLNRLCRVARCLDRAKSFARCNPLPALKRHPLPHVGEGMMLEYAAFSPLPNSGRGVGGEGCATLEIRASNSIPPRALMSGICASRSGGVQTFSSSSAKMHGCLTESPLKKPRRACNTARCWWTCASATNSMRLERRARR